MTVQKVKLRGMKVVTSMPCHGKSAKNMGYAGYLDHINGLMTIPQYGYQVHLMTMTYHDTHDQTRLVIPIAISQGKNIAAWTGNPVSGTPNITKNSYMLFPERRIPLSGK